MSKLVIVLDSSPLGLLCSSQAKQDRKDINDWANQWSSRDATIVIPQIIDYELRRELFRIRAAGGITQLDHLRERFSTAWLNDHVLERASYLWAKARWEGWPTAGSNHLDIDCLLAAQAESVAWLGDHLVVATSNAQHLRRYGLEASTWQEIIP